MSNFLSRSFLIAANGINHQVTVAGSGQAVLLLHGWPLTSHMWRKVTPALVAAGFRTIAPDLRGIGGSDRPESGYDVQNLADDAVALLDALDAADAFVVGIDLGVPVAWTLAMRHSKRILRLAVMEGLLGRLPGAEAFLAGGPPWWFGFHGVPGLAERVVEGREAEYLDWFLASRTPGLPGIDAAARAVYAQAYAGRDALRGGFEHYRAMPSSALQIQSLADNHRLQQPTLAISGGVVGDALAHQLRPHTCTLHTQRISGCGHNIPEEQPEALSSALLAFFAESR
ncbi:alpha/beta fold hydrolase [Burkholderia ubonensis]|uniref:alpha/beta fold hydrolase n=1 Tax=Burkholderia ubonensis TaxID=101571 RepID=UPI0009B31CF7|nr:alpha/beta hydrolase [Burkholderia ubonensis]